MIAIFSLVSTPYYNSWDMDLITAMDLLEIRSGNLPLHINHTGLGLYFLSSLYLKISSALNLVSISSYDELLNSWNMLFTIADFTSWLKYFNLFIILGIFGFTYLAAKNLLQKEKEKLHLFALFAVISTASIWNFHLYLIRTELYSLFFFSLAFYYLSLIKSQKKLNLYTLGLLLGLGFVTKFQGFFVMLTMIIMMTWSKEDSFFNLSKIWKLVILIVFSGLTVLSRLTYLPAHFAEFARGYGPNLFFLTVFGIILVSLFLSRPRLIMGHMAISPWIMSMFNKWVIIVLGILSCFLLAFSFYPEFSKGFEYFLYLWRMIFLKFNRTDTELIRHRSYLELIKWTLLYFGPGLMGLGILLFKSTRNIRTIIFISLAFGSLLLAQRGGDQDAPWNELLILWLVLYLSKEIASKWVFLSLLLIIFGNIKNLRPSTFFQSSITGQMTISRFLREPYENPFMNYSERIRTFYTPEFQIKSLHFAKDHLRMRQDLGVLWQGPHLGLDNLNIIHSGASLGKDQFIVNYSAELQDLYISGPDMEQPLIQLRLDRTDHYYMATSEKDLVRAENCTLKSTDFQIETNHSKLKVMELSPGEITPGSDLSSCRILSHNNAVIYVIKG